MAEPRRWRYRWIALTLVVTLAVLITAIPTARRAVARGWSVATSSPTRLLPEVPVTTHGRYAFEETTGPEGKDPVRYDPCRPIRYTINADLAPAGSAGIIPAAVAEVSRLTGLKFEYVGPSHTPVHYEEKATPGVAIGIYPPVEIAWATAPEFAALKVDHDGIAVGFGGSAALHQDNGWDQYVTGTVALRADQLAKDLRGPDGAARVKAVVLHELGHVVGLAHVNDRAEVMNPILYQQRDFGPGDREGLAILGQGPCT